MNTPAFAQSIPALAELAGDADRLHVKSVECRKTLREFLAAILSYMPGWMRMLYRVRWAFVRLLGARQEGIPQSLALAPEELSFTPGGTAAFFTVVSAEEERYWAGVAKDRMISGYLAVVAEPLENGANRFHILTMVKYHHWTGLLYFAVINPFHHLVVFCMARAGARNEA